MIDHHQNTYKHLSRFAGLWKSWGAACLLLLSFVTGTRAQERGTIAGTVSDASTQMALQFANVAIPGTTLGVSTDLDGEYSMKVAPGIYTLVASYIGYQSLEKRVEVRSGEEARVDFELIYGEALEEVTVTVQAIGQISAVREQVASSRIVNVVSAEKMEELPDANAAEAIGRLPGISLQRSSGEANKIVIRGVSPKHNNVTIAGVKMASTNLYDRSADLSLIQSEMLSGVEVSKSLRADMDASAVGGTVDLRLAEAEEGFAVNARAEGGYSNLYSSVGDYKLTGGLSNRFFQNRIGAKLQLTYEQKQLTSHRFGGNYSGPILVQEVDGEGNLTGEESYVVRTEGAVLTENLTDRERLGASVTLDFKSEHYDVLIFNLYNRKTDDLIDRVNTHKFTSAFQPFNHTSSLDETVSDNRVHSMQNRIRFANTRLDLILSYSQVSHRGKGRSFPFEQVSSGADPINQDWLIFREPAEVLELYGETNAEESFMGIDEIYDNELTDRNYDARLDWRIPFRISVKIRGDFSVGAKFHKLERTSDGRQEFVDYRYGAGAARRAAYVAMFPWVVTNAADQYGLIATNFVDSEYDPGDFLNGRYELGWAPDLLLLADMQKQYYDANSILYQKNGNANYSEDYHNTEESYAAYTMAEINVGDKLTLVPGIRFENERTSYQAYSIELLAANVNGIKGVPDSTRVDRTNNLFFPSVNMKYQLNSLLAVRGAAYRSASRPDFIALSPRIVLPENPSQNFTSGNPYLAPATAWNYDLGVEAYNNKLGLLSANLFYKRIEGFVFDMGPYFPLRNDRIVDAPAGFLEALPGGDFYPFEKMEDQSRTYIPVNNHEKAAYYGIELSYQKNFWYLNSLLRGLVLDANLTLINSQTRYPYFENVVVGIDSSGFVPREITGYQYQTRKGPLIDQPGLILNLIVGWDYKGFSSRFSFRYQDRTLKSLDSKLSFADSYYDKFVLMDISLKQRIIHGLSAYLNFTNIGNHIDEYYMQYYGDIELPTQNEYYGSRVQLGVSYQF